MQLARKCDGRRCTANCNKSSGFIQQFVLSKWIILDSNLNYSIEIHC